MAGNDLFASLIGTTPLVRLRHEVSRTGAQVWCKLEFMNPGGSSKDRMCASILDTMESEGIIGPDATLVEASCGNTAVSLAMLASARGYRLTLVMPESIPVRRRRFLQAYGAKIDLTPSSEGMRGAVNRAEKLVESEPGFTMINQFENPANPRAHRTTTAVEILEALGGPPDVFVAAVGTGGTITGVGEALKAGNHHTKVVAVEPAESSVLSGGDPRPHRIPGMGAGFVPKVLNMDVIDQVAAVTYDEAVSAVGWMARNEGLHVGLSSGASVSAALREARRLDPGKVVLTMIYDRGERYACLDS